MVTQHHVGAPVESLLGIFIPIIMMNLLVDDWKIIVKRKVVAGNGKDVSRSLVPNLKKWDTEGQLTKAKTGPLIV